MIRFSRAIAVHGELLRRQNRRPGLYNGFKILVRGSLQQTTWHEDWRRCSGTSRPSTGSATKASPSPSPPPPTPTPTVTQVAPSLQWMPPSLRPYGRLVRLDKPIGTYLLLWPCAWSTALGTATAESLGGSGTGSGGGDVMMTMWVCPDPMLLLQFAVGAASMRAAGCVANDLWDRDFDAQVARTRDRPLASGELSPLQGALCGAFHLGVAASVLYSLPPACHGLALASVPLVGTYPLMKRLIPVPQLFLGMTINWGCFVGWTAATSERFAASSSTSTSVLFAYDDPSSWIPPNLIAEGLPVVLPLYMGSIAWTLVYDTLYAHQDKADDKALGLQSSALTFGDRHTKPILIGCSAVAATGWAVAGANAGLPGIDVYYGGCLTALAHLCWQVGTADLNDPANLAQRFRSNTWVGAILFGSIVMGHNFNLNLNV